MRSVSRRIGVSAVLSLSLLLGAAGLQAQVVLKPSNGSKVKVGVSASGRKIIYSESSVERARRTSNRLVAVPSADLVPLIQQHASAAQLDPKLVQALIQVESGYNHRALSNKGAMGLMQLMPGTASVLRVQNPYDPDQNLRGGTTYLRQMIDRFQGKLEWAVAAYNAGPGAVERYGGIPPYAETRDYVRRVLSLYQGTAVSLAASVAGVPQALTGFTRKPYLIRNSQNRLVLTTSLDAVH